MFYKNLKFPKTSKRPFFYTNFVQTVDGKVAVRNPGYWPIGSKKDLEVLHELRAHADVLIHGGTLAKEFGEQTLNSLYIDEFRALRKKAKKKADLVYMVVSKNPEEFSHLKNVQVATDIKTLIKDLHKNGYKNILVEGGPTLLTSFLKINLIDEIFLTIAPKIFGSEVQKTLTLVEGYLFPANSIKNLRLISVKPVKNEIFLRYKVLI